jgi:hypothetical protein
MWRFFDVFKCHSNKSKMVVAAVAAASLPVVMMLHTAKAPTVPAGGVFVTKPVGEANPNTRVRDAFLIIATKPLGDALAPKPHGEGLASKPDGDDNANKPIKAGATKPGDDALGSKPDNDAVVKPIKDAATKPDRDALAAKPDGDANANEPIKNAATKPDRDALAAKPDGDANANKPIKDAATKPDRDALAARPDGDAANKPIQEGISPKPTEEAATNPDGDAIATRPAGDAIATKPTNYPVGPKKVAPIQQTTLAYEWQDWQYCLAPSLAEHKIYLSAPVPVNGIVASADAAFHEMLNKAGISHDEVQCPKAPNKRTLLFRQRFAIRLNEEIGNATINLNWEPHVD